MMLPLEKQVTSLGLSRRLAEAGLPTDTYFKWWKWKDEPETEWSVSYQREFFQSIEVTIPAYTTDELLEWLRRHGGVLLYTRRTDFSAEMSGPPIGPLVNRLPTPSEALGELALKVKEGR